MKAGVMLSADEAVALIPDHAHVVVDGSGGGVNEPSEILAAVERRFQQSGSPRGLTVIHPSGMGDHNGGGIDRFAHEGMVKRVIGGHWAWSDNMQQLAKAESIEAYCLPQGVISHLFRAIAGGQPGLMSKVGLGTFVDPRVAGGRLNNRSKAQLVSYLPVDGRDMLFYRSFPVDVAIIRATSADEFGNLTMEQEGLYAETLSVAQAAKNSGGIVMAQVKRVTSSAMMDPRCVKVPGILVDYMVLAPNQPLSIGITDDPTLWAEKRERTEHWPAMPLTERKVIARRAALELRENDVVNLGFGMPDGVASVLAEEGLSERVALTLEQGHIGGIPARGVNFGLAKNQMAIVDAGYQFDWYDGGGLDIAILSFAQFDRSGNVNVGKFGGRIAGVGGFINISEGPKRVVFVGTFMAGHQELDFSGNRLSILREGKSRKIVSDVEQISFSGEYAKRRGQLVRYVTERAVFELTGEGIQLTEIAPGIDLGRDVLSHMDFRPTISRPLKTMDASLFANTKMNLALQAEEMPYELHSRSV